MDNLLVHAEREELQHTKQVKVYLLVVASGGQNNN